MPTRPNGGFIGTENITDNASASGIYTLNEARELTEAGDFPSARYTPSKSVRFDRAASAYLYRTFGTPTTGTKWTYSLWIKKSQDPSTLGYASGHLLTTAGSGAQGFIGFGTNVEGEIIFGYGGYGRRNTNYTVFRDPSAWYHIVVAVDTTQTNETDRALLYVNGRLFSWSTSTAIGQGDTTQLNQAVQHNIGRQTGQPYQSFEGYMSDINFIDGQQLNCTDFGQRDPKTGMWLPKRYGGSYGNNGFFLSFANNASTTTLGYDDGTGAIGAGAGSNDWTPSGFSVATDENGDSFVDVPGIGSTVSVDTGGVVRGNYATWNGTNYANLTLSNGSLDFYNYATGSVQCAISTIGVSSGKWYIEHKVTSTSISGNEHASSIGVVVNRKNPASSTNGFGDANTVQIYGILGRLYYAGATGLGDVITWQVGQTMQVALDADARRIWFGVNGTWATISGVAGNPTAGTGGISISSLGTGVIEFITGDGASAEWCTAATNFGQRPFTYTPPVGFKSLCATNLPEPEIVRPYGHFDVKTYRGNNRGLVIGNTAREPDNYQLPVSLRFDGSSYLQRTPTYKTNRKRWTWSGWVKRSAILNDSRIFGANTDSNNKFLVYFNSSNGDRLNIFSRISGTNYQVETLTAFRDPSIWYHIVVTYDTTQATDSNRVKVYVNGISEPLSGTYPTQNWESPINNTVAQFVGGDGDGNYFSGYLANVHFIDGSILTPDSFGTFDVDGSWQAKEYSPATPMNMPRTNYVAYFDGTNDYVYLDTSSDYDFGSGDFTIECWLWPNNLPVRHQMIMHKGHRDNNNQFDWRLYYADSTVSSYQLWFECYIGGTQYGLPTNSTSAQHFKMNAWNHVVVTRVGSVLTGYLNGEQVGTASITTGAIDNVYNTTYFGVGNVGAAGQTYFDGYAADLRVIKGTGTFTGVPNAKLTAVTNTKLLTFQDSTFIDNSGTSKTLTATNALMIRHGADYGINGYNVLNTIEDTEAVPTWNYNPMGNFKTANSSGSFVNDTTYLYLTGASYDGGFKGGTVSLGSFKALQNSWNLDFILNRNGVNSSPFPNYTIYIGSSNSASTYYTGSPGLLCATFVGNAYNFGNYVYNGSTTTLGSFSESGSVWSYAGYAHRISFDVSTYTFTFYGNTSGVFTSMTQTYQYQLTSAQKQSIQTYINTDWYIGGSYRASNDGYRNIRWYTV